MFKYFMCTVFFAVKHFAKVTLFHCSHRFTFNSQWHGNNSPFPNGNGHCIQAQWNDVSVFSDTPIVVTISFFLYLVWIDIETCDNNEQGLISHILSKIFFFRSMPVLPSSLFFFFLHFKLAWNPGHIKLSVTCVVKEQRMREKEKEEKRNDTTEKNVRDDDDHFVLR